MLLRPKAAWSQREHHKALQHYLQEQRILQGRSSRRPQRLPETLQGKIGVWYITYLRRMIYKKNGLAKSFTSLFNRG